MKALRLLVGTTVALGASVGSAVLPAPARADEHLPPSLEGETFEAMEATQQSYDEVDVSASCTGSAGETFTINYTAEGIAIGPYPGWFTESGSVTVELDAADVNDGFGVVTSWTASFTIDSSIGQVSGTKTLSGLDSVGVCNHIAENDGTFGDHVLAQAELDYEATIRTENGTFTDEGVATAYVSDYCLGSAAMACDIYKEEHFFENFTASTGVVAVPLLPADKNDCKQGRHEGFGYGTQKECKDALKEQKKANR